MIFSEGSELSRRLHQIMVSRALLKFSEKVAKSVIQRHWRDHSKSRLDSYHLESNESIGLFGQHITKKPKMTRQPLGSLFDNDTPMSRSFYSPVASQTSNMSISNKLIKILAGRDRGRKAKFFKIPAEQSGPGSPWSLFEDQALLVLVHDTFLFKRIFRNLEEWMERHKTLMDRIAGDWADIGEDSLSSKPYPSTLPGIPKGSARQLFQCLQGPMEEDLTKTHFGKIIRISQKLLCHMTEVYFCFWSWIFEETNCVTSKMVSQHLSHCFSEFLNDNQDAEPIQVHSSHTGSLSQVRPNNLNIGAPLTPLDLCDTTALSTDILSLGCQDSQATGLAISNQSTFASVLPVSGAISSIQGSSNMVVGNNCSPPRGLLNALVRDGRSGVPRSLSFSIVEHWGMQQSDHMLSDRNIHHSGLSVAGAPPGTDCGIHMLSGGNGMGIARPEFQGTFPSAILNSRSMLSSSAEAMLGQAKLHSGVGSAQGNLMLRPQQSALNMRRVSVRCFSSVSQDNKIRNLKNPFVEVEANPPPTDSFSLRDFIKVNGHMLFEHMLQICMSGLFRSFVRQLITALIGLEGENIKYTLTLDNIWIHNCGERVYTLKVSRDGSADPFRLVYNDQIVGSAMRIVSLIMKEANAINVAKKEIEDLKEKAISGRWWVDASILFEHPFFLDTMQRITLISRSSDYLSCPITSQTTRRYIPRAARKLRRKIPQLLAYEGHWVDHLPNTMTEDEKDDLKLSYGRSFVQCVRYLRNFSQHFNLIGFDADAGCWFNSLPYMIHEMESRFWVCCILQEIHRKAGISIWH